MEFCSFSSGSSGNSYMIRQGSTVLLCDCGISGKKIFEGLKKCGLEPDDVSGVLISHEHQDHIKSIRTVIRKTGSNAFMNAGTMQSVIDKVAAENQVLIGSGDRFSIGGIKVCAFSVSHDAADPMAYSFEADGRKLSILTDTGFVSDEMEENICDSDLLVIEANHDVNVLRAGPYPYSLKQRILGDRGHLSNEAAGECIVRICRKVRKPRRILLAHLSHRNNTPDIAKATVCNVLEENGFPAGGDLLVDVLTRDMVSPVFRV